MAAILVATSLNLASPTATAAEVATVDSPAASTSARASGYRVTPGVTFNSPLDPLKKRRVLIRKVNAAIDHAKRGSEIRIFSWKIWTYSGVTALLNAQKRGVKVRAIMDRKNTEVENNPHFWRLQRGLRAGNKNRRLERHSGARLCTGSCRGRTGSAHSKFMLFSKTGQSEYVYMHSSANWGDPAAKRQWNDMYTVVGNQKVYNTGVKVFDQAWRDKPVKPTWVETTMKQGSVIMAWSPSNKKSRQSDRLLGTLRRTKCRGATGGAGNANGRTIIRVAPDVLRGKRGLAVSQEIRRLWDRGCDVKVGYTVISFEINRLFRADNGRGPVPIKHLTQDFDGDGLFDRYFHMKAYSVNGVIGKKTDAYFLQQGSANSSGLAQVSDETFGYFLNRASITKRYQNHMNYWYDNFPASPYRSRATDARIAAHEIDPYAYMDPAERAALPDVISPDGVLAPGQ